MLIFSVASHSCSLVRSPHRQAFKAVAKILPLIGMLLCTASIHAGNFPQDFQQALVLYNNNQIEEAKTAFIALSKSGPTANAIDQSLAYAADCQSRQKHYDEAQLLANQIKNKHLATLCKMNLFSSQRQFAELLALTKDEDFESWPDVLSYDAYCSRANAYARSQNVEQANKDFQAALSHTVSGLKKGQVYLRLGHMYSDQKSNDPRALAAFGEALKLQAGPTVLCQAAIARAKLLAAQGNREGALAELDRLKSLTNQPHWSMVQFGYAEVFTSLGSKEEALAHYKAIAQSKNPPTDLLEIAQTQIKNASQP